VTVKVGEGAKASGALVFVSKNPYRRIIGPKKDKWDQVWPFRDGLAKVKVGDDIGYVNKAGKEVWAPWATRRAVKEPKEEEDELLKALEDEEE
jgi:hypothetical protein